MTTTRRSIPPAEWPAADRAMWLAIIAKGDLLARIMHQRPEVPALAL